MVQPCAGSQVLSRTSIDSPARQLWIWAPITTHKSFPRAGTVKLQPGGRWGSFYRANYQAEMQTGSLQRHFVPLRGTGTSASVAGAGHSTSPQSSLRNSPWEGRKQPPCLSPRQHNRLPSSLPTIRAAGCCKAPSGTVAPPWHVSCSRQGRRAGSGSWAGKFLCIQSFYSIKISGSYSATSPVYCPGRGFWGAGRYSLLVAKGLSQPAGSTLETIPSPGSCSLPTPCPACTLLREPTLSKNSLLIMKHLFFPVDKTFSCGP